jgi:hypothetical protein
VEVYVEAVFYPLEDGALVDIVVARVDYADRPWPALLGGSDRCPKDSFAAAACVAAYLSAV